MYPRFWLLKDIYWCFIPLTCRRCDDLPACRSSFWKGRKCLNGCIKAKRKEAYLRELDRKDYIDHLVKSFEEREHPTHPSE